MFLCAPSPHDGHDEDDDHDHDHDDDDDHKEEESRVLPAVWIKSVALSLVH